MGPGGKVTKIVRKTLKEMKFHFGGGKINWYPGHMAVATRAIRTRIKIVDFVIEIRDARIPLTSAYQDIQESLAQKRRIIILNKKDLVPPHVLRDWVGYFESYNQHCFPLNAHHRDSVKRLLDIVEWRLKEECAHQPTLLIMVIGVPNVGKSVIINALHQIALSRITELGNLKLPKKPKKAKVGQFPGVTQDFSGFRIARRPSAYVLDTPGVLCPRFPDVETGLKLAVTGSIKDSIVGEDRIVRYILALLNTWRAPLKWKHLESQDTVAIENKTQENKSLPEVRDKRMKNNAVIRLSKIDHLKEIALEAKQALYTTFSEFDGDLEDAEDLDYLIEQEFEALRAPLKIRAVDPEIVQMSVAKKFLKLFRAGLLGSFVIDDFPVPT